MDAQGVWESIETQAGEAVDEKKSKMAKAYIFQAIPEDILLQVAKKETTKEVWKSLKTRYLGADRVQKARLHTIKSDFEALRMKEGETIDEFAGKLSGLNSKYNSLGSTLDDSVLVRKLLDSVPDKYLQLVASIEQYADIDTMPFEEATGRLKAYEDRLRLRSENSSGEASLLLTRSEGKPPHKSHGGSSFVGGRGRGSHQQERGGRSGGRGRGSTRGRGGRGSHSSPRDNNNSHWRGRDKSHIKCFNCEKHGHYASECPNPKQNEEKVNLTQTQEEEAALLLTVWGEESDDWVLLNEDKVFPVSKENEEDTWYLDNGASNHMTGVREYFAELDENVTGLVRFGDGSRVQIKGKGTILVECKNKEQLVIPEVYYIPALRSNILSLGQMTEEGYRVEMLHEFLRMHDERNRLIMKVQRSKNRLYKIVLHTTQPVCLSSRLDDTSWLWHARLGHVNFRVIEAMVEKGMVQGVPKIHHPTQVCEGCLIAKQTRQSYPQEAQWQAGNPLELVHADLCGPITPQTSAGNRYFLLFVDDYSRYMWVFMIKTKDEVFQTFKKFKMQVESEGQYKLKALRTDRGGEFTSTQFTNYCNNEGIKRQLTAPYSPQQNGVVERRNRTILGVTRSLLKAMSVPERLWGEAVRHAVQILNRVPTKGVKDMTPYEGIHGRKPALGHFRVFGCVAHAKIPSNKLTKLSDRSIALVYLGNEQGSKAYRLLNPKTNQICVARDVVFEENAKWNWAEVQESGPILSNTWTKFPSVITEQNSVGFNDPVQDETLSPTSQQNENDPQSPPSLSAPTNSSTGGPSNTLRHAGSIMTPTSEGSPEVDRSTYDDTLVRGFRLLSDIYHEAQHLEDESDELMYAGEEPTTFEEATGKHEWRDAMKNELESIEKNNTWRLTNLPKGKKAIGLKWVFKLKKNAEGRVTKHKARIVAKGYVQRKGIDFDEVFAPVARLETIRMLLALAANEGWKVHHLDVKSAFLNGVLQEDVYVSQPDGFVIAGKEHMVYKLNKALYGLRQAPRA